MCPHCPPKPKRPRGGAHVSLRRGLGGRLAEVVGPASPALNVTPEDAADYYPAGPPYLATARDLYRLAVRWVEFLPKVHALLRALTSHLSHSRPAAGSRIGISPTFSGSTRAQALTL